MGKQKKKKSVNVPKKKKFNIKEYLPIIGIIVAVVLFVGIFVVMEATEPVYTDATVYYMDADRQYVPQLVQVDEKKMEKGVIAALADAPLNNTYTNAVYGDIKVLSVNKEDGLCTVNLSKEFATENVGDDKEAYAVYAVVNTLCMLPDVERVKINVAGDEAHCLGDRIDLSNVLYPDWNMVIYEERPQW